MDEKKTAWERLQLVHTKGRPTVRDYIPLIFTDFYELHGDRHYGDVWLSSAASDALTAALLL